MNHLYLYGPPGSGKSTLGKLLAGRLDLPFVDVDRKIRDDAGMEIPEIFAKETEKGFRAREKRALEEVASRDRAVVALGGGALVDPACRAIAEGSGTVVFLDCTVDLLRDRVARQPGTRPLLDGSADDPTKKIEALMARRAEHYASFGRRVRVADDELDRMAGEAEVLSGSYRIASGDVPSDVVVGHGLLASVGAWAKARGLARRAVVVCDANTAPLYGARVAESLRAAGIEAECAAIPAGEETKTLDTVQEIWRAFQRAGLGRDDFAVAVGGGVTGDMTGFAAATWMRGMRWVNVPTTLLSMVDASTGGKTGCDLPGAKNMVGAFHSPSLVVADVSTLLSLPAREWRCGLAETVKHAFIADPGLLEALGLFDGLRGLPDDAAFAPADLDALAAAVSRALAVKVALVREDPREKGPRAKLNLGHTVGHAVEVATDFAVKHGEAVAIGTVEEARLAVRMGLASADWPEKVAQAFAGAGLPVELPAGVTFDSLADIMRRDKKKKDGRIRFALPRAPGDVAVVPVEL